VKCLQGAIEGSSLGFSQFCTSLFQSSNAKLCEIPVLLMNKVNVIDTICLSCWYLQLNKFAQLCS